MILTKESIIGYKVDYEGYVLETIVTTIGEQPSNVIVAQPPIGISFYKIRWDGTEWIEGATQEEIDELTKVVPQPPTQDERIKELETIVNLLLMGGL